MKSRYLLGAIGALLLVVGLVIALYPREKSTTDLLADLKSTNEKDRVTAVRLLPQRKSDTAKVMPGLVEALKDHEGDIRRSAAIGLGYLGDQAREAIPALQGALKDRDARVREAASAALNRIDPVKFTMARKSPGKRQ